MARAARLLSALIAATLLATACTGGSTTSPTTPPPASAPTAAPSTPAAPPSAARATAPSVSPATSPAVAAAPSAVPALAASPSPSAAAAAATSGWTTYHGDLARTGFVPTSPFDPTQTGVLWTSPALDGDIYAEPLAANGRIYVATENDTITALDAASGQVAWSTHLGDPVPASQLPCGNINPIGITSTPVIDPSAAVLYAVAFLQPAHHELVALDLASGAVRYRRPVDPPGADPRTHLNRAALSLSQGSVYVPFGGRFGDCGAYHGWVVAAHAADGSQAAVYQVPTQREGAIWAPGGATIAADGSLYVATGNGSSNGDFDYGDAVIKLSPTLQPLDWFAPSDWANLNARDLDLGSVAPALVGNNLLFQVGKSGVGYLARTDQLGHIGGEVFQGQVCSGGAYGSTASAPPLLLVPCRDGLVALRLDGQSFAVAWRGPRRNANPPIIVGNAVWGIDPGDGSLQALNLADGASLFQSPPAQATSGLPHFITPGWDGSAVLAARGRTVTAFSAR